MIKPMWIPEVAEVRAFDHIDFSWRSASPSRASDMPDPGAST
jgi:hypothetical protein